MVKLHRYEQFHSIFPNFLLSKLNNFSNKTIPKLIKFDLIAGLYKTNSMLQEHGLLLHNVSGCLVYTTFQLHGNRRRKTVSINGTLTKIKIWPALDKFTHELVPNMQDFFTPKSKKVKIILNSYTLRIRQKFSPVEDFNEILENHMHDTHKGIYLPLTLHFTTNKKMHPFLFETYLRALRLPISLFRRKRRPAYDDKVVFSGLAELYRDTTVIRRKKIKSQLDYIT